MADGLTVVVDRRGTHLSLDGRALRVDRPDGDGPERYPLGVMEGLIIHGRPSLDADVLWTLAERNIPTVVFPGRGQGPPGWITPGLAPTLPLRQAQHAAYRDPASHRQLAAWALDAKLLAHHQLPAWLEAEGHSPTHAIQTDLERARINLTGAADAASLRGIEGGTAGTWFGWLQDQLPENWGFQGRSRRPPRDPANALLSLGYTLAGAEMAKAVATAGLDPALGFLHAPAPGREALVLDLMEPLRAGVDGFVVRLAREGTLTPEDFHCSDQDGCRLGKDGRARFYAAWSEFRQQWPGPDPDRPTTLAAACRLRIRSLRQQLQPSLPSEAEHG